MALTKCSECGLGVSDKAKICPHCGVGIKRGIGCTGVIVILFLIFAGLPLTIWKLQEIIYPNETVVLEEQIKRQDQERRELDKKQQKKEESLLLLHKFSPGRPGRSKSQLRAIAQLGTMSEDELRIHAVRLCNKYKSHDYFSFLVQFFDDKSCLDGWDGTGLLRESDWPHWMCRITVETNSRGNLYANFFELALDGETGKKRTDVLR